MLNHIIFNGHNDDDDDYDSSTVYSICTSASTRMNSRHSVC